MTHTRPRTLLSLQVLAQTLAAAALIWVGSTTQQSTLAITQLKAQMADLQATWADVPDLKTRVARIEQHDEESDRRLDNLETGEANTRKMKEWQRK